MTVYVRVALDQAQPVQRSLVDPTEHATRLHSDIPNSVWLTISKQVARNTSSDSSHLIMLTSLWTHCTLSMA
ncbi:hypothetical protein NS14008_33590 [Nocardia seriolae]|nr:hypothetical protein NS14008_33590 [Nocardia seriolae]